jgi:hypothetical protein
MTSDGSEDPSGPEQVQGTPGRDSESMNAGLDDQVFLYPDAVGPHAVRSASTTQLTWRSRESPAA